MPTLNFTLNGKAVSLPADNHTLLVDLLRGPLALTGLPLRVKFKVGMWALSKGLCLKGAAAKAAKRDVGVGAHEAARLGVAPARPGGE